MFALLSFKEFFGSLDGNRTAERNDIVQLDMDFLFGFDQFDRVLIAQEKAFRQPEITCQPQIRIGGNSSCSVDNAVNSV